LISFFDLLAGMLRYRGATVRLACHHDPLSTTASGNGFPARPIRTYRRPKL